MDEAVKLRKRRSTPWKQRKEKRRIPHKYLYLPEMQRTKPGTAVIGYACRAFTAWLAVFGLLLFICDAFLFEVDGKFLALASLIPVALLAIAVYNRIGTLIAFGGTALSAALFIVFTGKPIEYTTASLLTLYNGIGARLASLGYRAPAIVDIDMSQLPVSTEQADLVLTGLVFISILLAVIVTLSCVKRVHMLPIIIAWGAICIVIFTYNLVGRSWGFTLMLTSFCGLAVMRAYESFFREAPEPSGKKSRAGATVPPEVQSERQAHSDSTIAADTKSRPRGLAGQSRGSALGGFAGLAAMIVAFAVLLMPTMSIRKKWDEIESINNKMEIARQILSSVIIGDAPDFSDLGYLGKMDLLTSRSTTASDRFFTGAKVLEVRTNYNTPLYVRSFVSSTFENDRWLVPQKNEISSFFSQFGFGFVGERIAKNFFDTVNPKLSGISNYTSYTTRYDYGFITTPVDIKLLSSSGNLLFLPSRYDPDIALLSFGGTGENAYNEEYTDHSDGIITTSWFNFNKSYRVLSYAQSYRHENVFRNLTALRSYYNICRSYIERTMVDGTYYGDLVKTDILALGLEILADDNAYERWYAMDEVERTEFYRRFTTADSYGVHVHDIYTSVPESESSGLFKLALTALADAHPELRLDPETLSAGLRVFDGKLYIETGGQFMSVNAIGALSQITTYEKVMAVIDYLKDNYTYTLTPKEPRSDKLGSVEAFLSDTKEGYCVQFATAAALMLRTLGVPTRYCEGYIAPDFKLDKSVAGEGRYVCTVRDFNAHAWIEVYVDDIGWLTFETTPEYYAGMYEHFSLNVNPISGGYETPEYIEPEDIDLEDDKAADTFDIAQLVAVIAIALAVVAALGAAIYFVRKFVVSTLEARYLREKYIETALRSFPEGDERRATAFAIIDYISAALAAAGLRPRTGELPSEYRARCERVLRGEEPVLPERQIKLPGPIGGIVSKLTASGAEKKAAKMRKTTDKKLKKRTGSLGVADEFTGAKGELAAPQINVADVDYARLFDSIQREEFGPGMSADELRDCAQFLVALSNIVYSNLNPLKKIWHRHIKHTI